MNTFEAKYLVLLTLDLAEHIIERDEAGANEAEAKLKRHFLLFGSHKHAPSIEPLVNLMRQRLEHAAGLDIEPTAPFDAEVNVLHNVIPFPEQH